MRIGEGDKMDMKQRRNTVGSKGVKLIGINYWKWREEEGSEVSHRLSGVTWKTGHLWRYKGLSVAQVYHSPTYLIVKTELYEEG